MLEAVFTLGLLLVVWLLWLQCLLVNQAGLISSEHIVGEFSSALNCCRYQQVMSDRQRREWVSCRVVVQEVPWLVGQWQVKILGDVCHITWFRDGEVHAYTALL